MSDFFVNLSRREFLQAAFAATAAAAWMPAGLFAQQPLDMGFARAVPGVATGEERARQKDIWMMDIAYKPMRLLFADVLDPATRQKNREQIWYLCYRVIRRPVEIRDAGDVEPQNTLDPIPGSIKFLPQFTFVSYDDPKTEIPNEIKLDMIVPDALAVINKVEKPNKYLDSVRIVQDLPEPVAVDAPEQPYLYGVAVWKGIDPATDFFKVIVSGLNNIYEARGEEGQKSLWRKVLIQKFHRRGDRFDPNLKEFEFDGAATWDFQPDRPAAVTADAGQ
jgi:hypothetical protein